MAAIDYEAQYNNRALVPEHPEIFARWIRDAELYRADMLKAGRAELGLAYGDTPRQFIDLFRPAASGAAPLALFIHGGYWRSLDPSMFSHMARGLNQNGIAVAMVGYDLCPNVGIADIIAQMRRACVFLWQRLNQPMFACGHSAGGHLAAALVGTDWAALYPKAPANLVPAGYAISGVYDLTVMLQVSQNQDLRLTAEDARAVSPVFWRPPAGRLLDAVAGALESAEFKRQSKLIADAWQGAAITRYEEIAGANHFTIIDPLADPQSAMVARVAQLAREVKA
jgi:arylformamidase